MSWYLQHFLCCSSNISTITCPCSKGILLCVRLWKKIWYNTYLHMIMLALPHTTHNSKMTWCQGTYTMASTATHGPPASILVQCASSPLHGQHLARSVCFILCWGVCYVTFLSVCFKANFHQSGATSSVAYAATHGSLPPVLVWCACTPHHVRFPARLVCFILRLGLLGVPTCNLLRIR
jgi:hypothetical protein